MKRIASLLLLALTVEAYPPGSPMTEFGPNQMALGVYLEQSGQNVFAENVPSFLNTTGVNLDYAPLQYLQLGVFGGGGTFDNDIQKTSESKPNIQRFESGFMWQGGVSTKLATPRFIKNSTRLVTYGSANYFSATSSKSSVYVAKSFVYEVGGSVQILVHPKFNLVLGGEFMAFDGTHTNDKGKESAFSNVPEDQFRGLIGFEYYVMGKNKSYISVALRPSQNFGWEDKHGFTGAALSISLGAISITSQKGNLENGEEDSENAE